MECMAIVDMHRTRSCGVSISGLVSCAPLTFCVLVFACVAWSDERAHFCYSVELKKMCDVAEMRTAEKTAAKFPGASYRVPQWAARVPSAASIGLWKRQAARGTGMAIGFW